MSGYPTNGTLAEVRELKRRANETDDFKKDVNDHLATIDSKLAVHTTKLAAISRGVWTMVGLLGTFGAVVLAKVL